MNFWVSIKYKVIRKLAYWFALRIAEIFFILDKRGRRAVMENYSVILKYRKDNVSNKVLKKLALKNFRFFAKHLVDFFLYSNLDRDYLQELIVFENYQYFVDTLNKRKGLVLLTGHIGNWELGGAVLASLGYNINAVFLPEKIRWVNNIFYIMRRRRGINVLPLGNAIRSVLRVLNSGGIVAMLADRDYTSHHVEVPFFGKNTRFSIAPVRIAVRTHIPILVGFLLRNSNDNFTLRFYPPIIPSEDTEELSMLMQIISFFEKEIGQNLEQWFMFDNFWK